MTLSDLRALLGFESISDGSTIVLSKLGAVAAHLKTNVTSDSVGKVQLAVNGESYMDEALTRGLKKL